MEIIQNPVLRGFHPDPCLCKAQGKYYLITSTFEWLPGVSLYESDDLVNWTSRGGLLTDLDLTGIPDSAGIWAPALSWDGEQFYLIYTVSRQIDGIFKDVENYVTTAASIDGPWSKPVFLNASGFDPSMFHENGRHYILNPQWDSRPLEGHKKFNGLILQEFDFEKGMVGESRVVFRGSGSGGTEGPHLMKKDGFYYILAAENGTGRHHAICVGRAKDLWGPYEVSPYHPLVTAWERDTTLKKSGHGNLVETDGGEWYLCHLCARYLDSQDVCPLGRETALQKVEWVDGWPRLVQGDCTPLVQVQAPAGTGKKTVDTGYQTNFAPGTDLAGEEWLFLRTPLADKGGLTAQGLCLRGGDSLSSLFRQSLLARRWERFDFEAGTTLRFAPYHYAQTAGLVCYYNTKVFHYLYVGWDEEEGRRVVNVLSNDNGSFTEPLAGAYIRVPEETGDVHLRVEVHQSELRFFCAFDDGPERPVGPVLDASILSDEHAAGWAYTGATVGITAVDTFNKDTGALFTGFYQRQTGI